MDLEKRILWGKGHCALIQKKDVYKENSENEKTGL